MLLLSQASLSPTPEQAQLSARIANDILESIVKTQTTFRHVLEESQSETEEWVQTVCATFATLVLTIADLRTINFETTFLQFFGEPAFFKVVTEMIDNDELRSSDQCSYGALLFATGFYLQTNKAHPEFEHVGSALAAYVESELENSLSSKTLVHSDLVERWSTDEEELFFEVIGNDAARLALKKQARQRMIEQKWFAREGQLFRQLLVSLSQ